MAQPPRRSPLGRPSPVLCGIDFSEQSRRALRYAETVARRAGAALWIVYVSDPLIVAAAEIRLHDRQWIARSHAELTAFVASALGRAAAADRAHTVVRIGDPADRILAEARRSRAGLIVIGTHGLTGARRVLAGSTALGVLQRTTVPVLAVPAQRGSRVPPGWPGARVIAAIDLRSGAQRQADIAARLARRWHSSLLLAHVVDIPPTVPWAADLRRQRQRRAMAQADARLESLAAVARRTAPAHVRVVCGRAADEIARLARAERSGLVMTMLRDRRRWFGAARGSVSYHVLAQAVAPVLAYPPRWQGWPREGRG